MDEVIKKITEDFVGLYNNEKDVYKLTEDFHGVNGLIYLIKDEDNLTVGCKIVTKEDDCRIPHLTTLVEEDVSETPKQSIFAKIKIPKNLVPKLDKPIVELTAYGVQVANDYEAVTSDYHIVIGDSLEEKQSEPYGYLYLSNSNSKAHRMYRESIIYNSSSIVFFEMLKRKKEQYRLLS